MPDIQVVATIPEQEIPLRGLHWGNFSPVASAAASNNCLITIYYSVRIGKAFRRQAVVLSFGSTNTGAARHRSRTNIGVAAAPEVSSFNL